MTTGPDRADRAPSARRVRPPRLIAAGFVAAFAASIATMIYTGLLVNAPRQEIEAERDAGETGAGADRGDGSVVRADGRQADKESSEDPADGIEDSDDETEHNEAGGDLTE